MWRAISKLFVEIRASSDFHDKTAGTSPAVFWVESSQDRISMRSRWETKMVVFIAERFSGRLGRIMESWLLDPNPLLPPLLHVPPSASSSASFTHRDPVPCSAPVWFATLAPVGTGLRFGYRVRFGSGLRCRGPKPDCPKQRCVRNPYPTAPCRKVLLLPRSCKAMV
jgi:hypothetical protein